MYNFINICISSSVTYIKIIKSLKKVQILNLHYVIVNLEILFVSEKFAH